ncbi:MAG TPA: hypothetical protein VFG19_16815, partial [Geobacteraceae bacterium]|nr:hypothetical protein [Geobacteraceae bacterium]
MPDSKQPAELHSPLAIMRDTPAGMIYGLTSKDILLQGMDACRQAAVTGAEWSGDRSVLAVKLESGPRVTFTA